MEGAAGVFMVEEWTGIIRTVARLDRERVAQYMLVLQAQDSSLTEARSATTQVKHSDCPLPLISYSQKQAVDNAATPL